MTSNAPVGSGIAGSLRTLGGTGIVHLECRFDSPAEHVWSALTDPQHLGQWLGELEGELRLGNEFQARFFATGWEGIGRVEACEPAERMTIATKSAGEPDCIIEATLVADGEGTLLVVEDRGLPLAQLAAYGAGDQVLVEDLAAYLVGRDRCDAQARWRELHPAYQKLAGALAVTP